jgi:hypothetical protein
LQFADRIRIEKGALLLRLVDNVLRTVDDCEIGRHREKRSVRFRPLDVRELKSHLAHSRVTALAGHNGFQIG